jgi:N-acylglucosamine 2-epimerase
LNTYAQCYKDELLEHIIPFWESYSADRENGGYFTCINALGKVYDTDKFIWLQARQVWMFATLYQKVEQRPGWLEFAKSGAAFLEKYGQDPQGNWYFSLTKDGKPLVEAYNIFSDCFAAMAFSRLYEITGTQRYATLAITTFERILDRQDNPKGKFSKLHPGTRELKNFALPMIMCNLTTEMAPLLGSQMVQEVTHAVVKTVMEDFYQVDSGLILENISLDGGFSDSFEGRLVNPGHAIEAMWFVIQAGLNSNDLALVKRAEEIMFKQLEFGWDQEYGGIFYFMDCKGAPPQQLEHDQKLWWVHLETLVALSKTYAHSRNPKALQWFEKVHKYTWSHFRDPIHGGEWYGYLNRQGAVHLPLKGGKWKGCFHVPRALMEIWKTLEPLSI